MNFDDLKNSYLSINYRQEGPGDAGFVGKIESLANRIREIDRKDAFRIRAAIVLLSCFGFVTMTAALIRYLESPFGTAFYADLCLFLAAVTVVPLLFNRFRRNRTISYNVPVSQFLDETTKRYRLFQPYMFLAVPFLLLLDASFVFRIAGETLPTLTNFLQAQLVAGFIFAFGMLVRMMVWRKKLDLIDELTRISQSLQEKNATN